MSYKDNLKTYLPEIAQNKNTNEFADGVGELLDNFKKEINQQKYLTDYRKLKASLLEYFADHFDMEFPKGLSENKKRIQLRDAIDAYRQTGTEDALLRIFRLIGWEVTIDHVWTKYKEGGQLSTQYIEGNTVEYSESSPVRPIPMESLVG